MAAAAKTTPGKPSEKPGACSGRSGVLKSGGVGFAALGRGAFKPVGLLLTIHFSMISLSHRNDSRLCPFADIAQTRCGDGKFES